MRPLGRIRLLVGVVGAVPVLTALAVVVVGTPPAQQPAPAEDHIAATPDPAAAARLQLLADRLTSVPADQHSGPYTYTHDQSWHALQPWAGDPGRIGRVERRSWNHANGSSRLAVRRLPHWPGVDHVVDGSDRPEFATAPLDSRDYTVQGTLARVTVAPEQVPTDPPRLLALLKQTYRNSSIDRLLYAITELNEYAYLRREQRATVLRVLAGIPGIGYDDRTADIAGRIGVTVHYTDPAAATTSWLAFHPATGQLLAYHRVFDRPYGRIFSSYTLWLEHDRREHP